MAKLMANITSLLIIFFSYWLVRSAADITCSSTCRNSDYTEVCSIKCDSTKAIQYVQWYAAYLDDTSEFKEIGTGYRNGSSSLCREDYDLVTWSMSSDLFMYNVTSVFSATYLCDVYLLEYDSGQHDSIYMDLNVDEWPSVILLLLDQCIDEYADITVRCESNGWPAVSYKWLYENWLIDDIDSEFSLNDEGNELTIYKMNRNDSGLYVCVTTNENGTTAVSELSLRVHVTPELELTTRDIIKASMDDHIVFSCVIKSWPQSSAIWYKDGVDITGNNDSYTIYEVISTNRYVSRTVSTLTIDNLQSGDYGNYTCKSDINIQITGSVLFIENQDTMFGFQCNLSMNRFSLIMGLLMIGMVFIFVIVVVPVVRNYRRRKVFVANVVVGEMSTLPTKSLNILLSNTTD